MGYIGKKTKIYQKMCDIPGRSSSNHVNTNVMVLSYTLFMRYL